MSSARKKFFDAFIKTNSTVYISFAFLVVSFLLLKVYFLEPRFSDGHMYTYMGYLVTKGLFPYKDFYYSSPPILPYFMALYGTITQWKPAFSDAIPIGLTLIDTILIFRIGCQFNKSSRALLGSLLYLFSFVVLATTDFSSDVHWITTFMLLAWWSFLSGYTFLFCFFLALTVLIKLYALVIVFAAFLLLFCLQGRKKIQVIIPGTLLFIFGTFALFYINLGSVFIDEVLLNNLNRKPGLSTNDIISYFINHDLWFLPSLFLLLPSLRKNIKNWIFLVPIFIYAVFILYYQDIYYLYLKPLPAYIAVLVALSPANFNRKFITVILTTLILSVGIISFYRYKNTLAEASTIENLDDIVKYVSSETSPNETIYGENSFVPLIALLADRKIFNNYVDTNIKFVNQGLFSLESRAEELSKGHVTLILQRGTVEQSRITSVTPVVPVDFLFKNCLKNKIFPLKKDYSYNAVLVWTCFKPGI
ncbi:MAG: hypothetical protein ACXVCP_15025 [Bdellovibrio sp.]